MSIIEGWQEIYNLLEKGVAIIVAGGEQYDIPSLHNFYKKNSDKADKYWRTIDHLGFGFFRGFTENGKFEFDGGGAMRHYSEGDNWLSFSPLRCNNEVLEDLEYDIEDVKTKVKAIIEAS